MNYIKKLINSQEFFQKHRKSTKDFIRKRCLTFNIVICFLLNLIKGSYQDELDYFFKALNHDEICERTVTKAAFCKARKKLKYEAFVDLNHQSINFFYENASTLNWQGFNLMAIDGSTIQLPKTPEVAEHFGVLSPNKGEDCPLARISQMFDVLNHVTVDAVISPISEGEREIAQAHFTYMMHNDLILLDRGYPAYWLFNLILSQGGNFCARVKVNQWKIVRKFFNSDKKEKIINLKAPGSSITQCKEMGLDIVPLKLRLIRVELETGESEVLITSLTDKEKYPHEIFSDLYHQRWPVEEDYKIMKSRIEIGNWSGKSVRSVYQDFHAKVFTKNFTAMMAHSVKEKVDNNCDGLKYKYQINITQALSKIKDTIVLLFNRPCCIMEELLIKIRKILIKTIEPVRPGRKFPRKHKVSLKRFYPCYKPIR